MNKPTLSVCIPAYGRVQELGLLLKSLLTQDEMPLEIIVGEDHSPQREQLRATVQSYTALFQQKSCHLRFEENPSNLGYDGNLRRLISLAQADYIFFIGNDDYVLPEGIKIVHRYLQQNPVFAVSRAFARFIEDPCNPIGYSRAFKEDTFLNPTTHASGWVMRIGGFFGGLVFQRQWAHAKATERYDGTLYYQMYLLLHAYCEDKIGYISKPTVAARANNAPLFGMAAKEKALFTPGSYTAIARGKMWKSILDITEDVGKIYSIDLVTDMRSELGTRMSFHVFEMFAGRSLQELNDLRSELVKLNLFNYFLPQFFYWHNRLLKKHALTSYTVARRLLQR